MSIEYGFAKTQNGQFYPPFLFIQAHFYRTFWQFHKLTFHFEVSNPVFAREIPHPFITEFHHSCVVSKKKRMGITNRIFKEQNNTMLTLFVIKIADYAQCKQKIKRMTYDNNNAFLRCCHCFIVCFFKSNAQSNVEGPWMALFQIK